MSGQRCWIFGDNIDTDQIMPSQYLVLPMDEMLKHTLETQSESFAKQMEAGDFIVGGENFGCGSSREQAPLALKKLGVRAIIAKSFARIFFRNAINIGLLLIEIPSVEEFSEGDLLEVNVKEGLLKDATTSKNYNFFPPTGLVKDIFESGGLIQYLDNKK